MKSPNCLFCKIANKEMPASVVSESSDWLSINDIGPQAPTHILVIPKKHIESAAQLTEADRGIVSSLILEAVCIARNKRLSERGYRIVINCNKDGGQTVPHLHVHLLGGRQMKWPPG